MSHAISDYEAFLPLQRLVRGPFVSLEELRSVERFIRAVVLHDEMSIEAFPSLLYFDATEFKGTEAELRASNFDLRGFEHLLNSHPLSIYLRSPDERGYAAIQRFAVGDVPDIEINPDLVELASQFSKLEGKKSFNARVGSLKRVFAVIQQGGSALLAGEFGARSFAVVRRYPEALFYELDEKWQRFARTIDDDGMGLLIPPVLGIVLTRCARRDAVPCVIRDLRDEWASARRKVWDLFHALRSARTLGEGLEIRQELSDASKLFSPDTTEMDTRPVRVLWEIIAAGVAGAATAALSGGKPAVGAATNTVGQLARSLPAFTHEFGAVLFGRGAFDLARRVSRAVSDVELRALQRLLSDAEKQKLGLK